MDDNETPESTPTGLETPPAEPSEEPSAGEVVNEESGSEQAPPWATISDPVELLSHESLKVHLDEREFKARESAFNELEPKRDEVRKSATATAQRILSTFGRLEKALDPRNPDADSFAQIIQDNAEHLGEIGKWLPYLRETIAQPSVDEGAARALYSIVMEATGDEKAAARYYSRAKLVRDELDSTVMKDLLQLVTTKTKDQTREDARKPLIEENTKLKAELERVKAQIRKTDGAANLGGGSPSGGRPSPQEYANASREQRDEWRKKGIEPLV